jgi:FMN-dependent NADH-azoreductase
MKILHIDASARHADSVSRKLSADLVARLAGDSGQVTYRDASQKLPFVDEQLINAYFTPEDARTPDQRASLALSNQIVAELKENDVMVIGVPIYNFSMPAALKAWADLAARVGETFRYTEQGPLGLLENKKAYIVVASGGTVVGSPIDFLTPWLKHYLGFIGITDVSVISADALNQDYDATITQAEQQLLAIA